MFKNLFVLPLEAFYSFFLLDFGGDGLLRLLLGFLLAYIQIFDVGEFGREPVFERKVLADVKMCNFIDFGLFNCPC